MTNMITIVKHTEITDERGSTVLFNYPDYNPVIVYSTFKKNVLKGLHFQTNPWCVKKVYLLKGCIIDVCVSLHNNNNLGVSTSVYLTAPLQFVVPIGYAHGVLALEDTELMYDFIPYWDNLSTYSLKWNDEQLEIPWKQFGNDFIMSDKDKRGLTLQQIKEMGLTY